MDEYSISHQEPEHEPKRGAWPCPARNDLALADIKRAIEGLKRTIEHNGPLHDMQTRQVHGLIKDMEHLTRGRWVA